MAKSFVARGGSSTTGWSGGVNTNAYISNQFHVPYSATNLSPADGVCYALIPQISCWLWNSSANPDATVRTFYATSAALSGVVYSSTFTLSNTTAAEKIGDLTSDPLVSSTSSTSTVRYFGFRLSNTGYWNQYYDSTGTNTTGFLMYVNGTRTNTSTGPFKWGSSTTRWETAAELRGRIYYNTLPGAPSDPTLSSRTSTQIVAAAATTGADDGYATSGTAITGYRFSKDNGATYTDVATTSGGGQSGTLTGLTPNTNYTIKVALLNAVATTAGTTHSGPYTATGLATRTLIAPPTTSGSYTATGTVGTAYSSNVTWTTPSGGGAVTPTWTYAVHSGSLPDGLTLNTSTGAITGTPTTAGVFTFTARVQSQDYDASTYTSGRVVTASQTITVEAAAATTPKVYNGTTFVSSAPKAWNGTTWVDATVKVYDGTTWKDLA